MTAEYFAENFIFHPEKNTCSSMSCVATTVHLCIVHVNRPCMCRRLSDARPWSFDSLCTDNSGNWWWPPVCRWTSNVNAITSEKSRVYERCWIIIVQLYKYIAIVYVNIVRCGKSSVDSDIIELINARFTDIIIADWRLTSRQLITE